MDSVLFEKLASAQHDIWAHWINYMSEQADGTLFSPEQMSRWLRQANTSYEQLTEKEKESDRDQVRKFWHLLTEVKMSKAIELSNAFGYLTEKEVLGIKGLVITLPPAPLIINIGAGAGTSSVAMLETRSDVSVCTIDVNQDGALGSLQGELNALVGIDIQGRHYQILQDSKTVSAGNVRLLTGTDKINMVFVDGDHSREGVRGDIDTWLPRITPGGIIAFDDYGDNEHDNVEWPEVKIAIDELVAPSCELILQVDSLIAFRIAK